MSPRLLAVVIALLLSAASARAQIVINQVFYVGSAANCTYSNVQVAIDHAAAGDYIFVAPSATPYLGHLSITKSIHLAGTDACGDMMPPNQSAPFATISGAGGNNTPAIAISGTVDVTIKGLEITGGHASSSDGYGGGIAFRGSGGSLHLANVVIHHNTAWRGGGLAVAPSGSTPPSIHLDDDVQIFFNTTTDAGAGIYIDGSTELFVTGVGDFIAFNTAAASGGGLFVRGPAHAALGSPGLNGALVAFNQAQYGGGIAAYGSTDNYTPQDPIDRQLVSIFATDAHSPGTIADNTAFVAGGGLYAKPHLDFSTLATADLCAQDFVIDGNVAPDGAAIYQDVDTRLSSKYGPDVHLNTTDCRSAATFNAVHCAVGVRCNEISDNATLDANGHVTSEGAIVNAGAASHFSALRLRLQGNTAAHLFNTFDHDDTEVTSIQLELCLTGGNVLSREMFRMQGEGDANNLSIMQCTLAPDIIGAAYVITFDNPFGISSETSGFRLYDTIIDEPGTLTVHYPGGIDTGNGQFMVRHLLSNDTTTLPGAEATINGTPLFVNDTTADVHARDYHLRAYVQNGEVIASLGIDFAPVLEGQYYDLDGMRFDQNVPLVPEYFHHGWFRDLGAYETQPIMDRIFADAFGDPVSLLF